MALKYPVVFLEEYLRNCCNIGSINNRAEHSVAASTIIQAWSELRNSIQIGEFRSNHITALETLHNSRTSLYVADPQAKLLLSILYSSKLSLPFQAYQFMFKILYIWVRKSARPSPKLMESAIETLSVIISPHFKFPNSLVIPGVILLGALSCAPGVSERSRTVCLGMLCMLLAEGRGLRCSSTSVSEVFAGIGYALSVSGTAHLGSLLYSLLGTWVHPIDSCSGVANAVMVLHLVEWVLSGFIHSNALHKIQLFCWEVQNCSKRNVSSISLIMAAFGLLKSFGSTISKISGVEIISRMRLIAEDIIELITSDLISKQGDLVNLDNMANTCANSLILKCISVGLAQSSPVSCRPCVLICLTAALLIEVFPLKHFYSKTLEWSLGDREFLISSEAAEHLESIPFREAGAATAVLCNHYALVDNENKSILENLLWNYCHDIYRGHRWIASMLREIRNDFLESLEKIAESAFLMVVLFSNAITKHRLTSENSVESCMNISVHTLVSFSCVEYFRRMRVAEYLDTIRTAVMNIQENEAACISFIESMPSYVNVINQNGFDYPQKQEYIWFKDDVQTARIVFYMRVIPTCIAKLPVTMFRDAVLPTIFLYMGHPGGKAAGASHALFSAFISSAKDMVESKGASLKEQIVFYYVERSLKGYPDMSPFDGMASGVVAIVRHLPAGSPSVFYCIDQLAEKVDKLCGEDAELWKNWNGNSGPSKKLVELLIKLVFLVDIQVLPYMMKLMAELIVKLPKEGQSVVVGEMYRCVAESDDVTRKPTLVSWLQSMSYICFVEALAPKQVIKGQIDLHALL